MTRSRPDEIVGGSRKQGKISGEVPEGRVTFLRRSSNYVI